MQSGFRSIEPEVSTKSITWGRMFRMSGPCADALSATESDATKEQKARMGIKNLIVSP